MKKILVVGTGVVPVPPTRGGGTEIFLYEISKFISSKFKVAIVDRRWPGTEGEEVVNGIRFYRIRVPKLDNVFALRATEFLLGLRSLEVIRKLRPDIVHAHTPFTAFPLAVLRFALPRGTKLVYTCHNPAWTVPDSELDPFNLFIQKVEGFVMGRCDAVTADSRTARASILRKSGLPSEKIFALYNFIDLKRFSRVPRGRWKSRMGLKGPMVLYASKLTKNKGIDVFLRAAPLIKEHFPNARFVVVGPVTFEREVQNPWLRLAEEEGVLNDVIFTGAVSDEEFPQILASADVFCLPTHRETFCITVVEAMASGLPVLTSRLEALEEVTGGGAILVEKGNALEVAKGVTKLLSSRELRKSLRRKAREIARKYDKRRRLAEYLHFYQRLLAYRARLTKRYE